MSENSPFNPDAPEHEVQERSERWLVAPLPGGVLPQGVSPLPPDSVFDRLAAEPDVELHDRIAPSERLQTLSGDSVFPEVGVCTMSKERARQLNAEVPIHVERDRRLIYGVPTAAPDDVQATVNPAAVSALSGETRLAFVIRGSDGAPLPRATVALTGASWPAKGVTDSDGRVVISLLGETPGSITAVYAQAERDYWDRWVVRPQLVPEGDNLITLDRLDQTVPDFPGRQMFGWGQKAMHLDRIPPSYRAHGIKVAVIDSGIATSHPDLTDPVVGGTDVADNAGWSVDVIGHGTHCAGVIAGADTGTGIIGAATEAEIHACKIFPGGRISALLAALDYCIEQNIDVVNLSLGTGEFSPLVAQKIAAARSIGMACIAAAGNNGSDKVLFPASLDTVLTVAAMGKVGESPQDSSHAFQMFGEPTSEGYFSAKFSAYGPGVDVCAPGVAIISSIPPDGYAAQDGTSMAAPHVTSLAALTLAHHTDFHQQFVPRNEARVERLFQILRDSCQPLDFGDPRRSGAGLPNAVQALGLESSRLIGGVTAGTASGFTRTSALAAVDQLGQELASAGIA
jgi:subtilisin family serine protease